MTSMDAKELIPLIAAGLSVIVAIINLIIAAVSRSASKAGGVNVQKLTEAVQASIDAMAESNSKQADIIDKLVDLVGQSSAKAP